MEELFEENVDPIKVYFAVNNQVIIAGDKVIGIDVNAIKNVMEIYKVKNQESCFDKVRKLFDFFKNEDR